MSDETAPAQPAPEVGPVVDAPVVHPEVEQAIANAEKVATELELDNPSPGTVFLMGLMGRKVKYEVERESAHQNGNHELVDNLTEKIQIVQEITDELYSVNGQPNPPAHEQAQPTQP